jgi:uncharacterized protein YegP (UPF0339 family)
MAYFKIVRRAGGYRGQYWAGGNLVWWTETYVRKAGAEAAIASLRRNAATAPLVDEAKAA